jgi:hypothetical protein
MAGPSFFSVRQDVASPVGSRDGISDPAPFTSVSIRSVDVTRHKDSPVGVNVGVDGTFLIVRFLGSRFVGIGGFVRYAGASVELPMPVGVTRSDTKLKAGGAQAGGGLRLRF